MAVRLLSMRTARAGAGVGSGGVRRTRARRGRRCLSFRVGCDPAVLRGARGRVRCCGRRALCTPEVLTPLTRHSDAVSWQCSGRTLADSAEGTIALCKVIIAVAISSSARWHGVWDMHQGW